MSVTIEKPAFKDTTASVLLDLLRGLAALLVLLGHWRNLLFMDYPQLTAHKALLLTALLVGEQRWVPDAKHIFKGLAILAVTLLYAHMVASLTEFHTDSIRHWVESRLGLAKKPACASRSSSV